MFYVSGKAIILCKFFMGMEVLGGALCSFWKNLFYRKKRPLANPLLRYVARGLPLFLKVSYQLRTRRVILRWDRQKGQLALSLLPMG